MNSPYEWPSIERQAEWAARLEKGDETVWGEIHDGLALPIAKIICRDYYRIIPEDLAADAMVVLWAKRGLYKVELGSLRSFLFTLTRHAAIDMIRKLGEELPVGGEFFDKLSHPLPPGEPSELVLRLAVLLDSLSERDRDIVMGSAMAEGEGYADELAKRYKIPSGHVRVIAQRIRNRLRAKLADE